jgi:hypothetical protein
MFIKIFGNNYINRVVIIVLYIVNILIPVYKINKRKHVFSVCIILLMCLLLRAYMLLCECAYMLVLYCLFLYLSVYVCM